MDTGGWCKFGEAAGGTCQVFGQPGSFTVRLTTAHNSLYQASGLASEAEVQAWIQETTLLLARYN